MEANGFVERPDRFTWRGLRVDPVNDGYMAASSRLSNLERGRGGGDDGQVNRRARWRLVRLGVDASRHAADASSGLMSPAHRTRLPSISVILSAGITGTPVGPVPRGERLPLRAWVAVQYEPRRPRRLQGDAQGRGQGTRAVDKRASRRLHHLWPYTPCSRADAATMSHGLQRLRSTSSSDETPRKAGPRVNLNAHVGPAAQSNEANVAEDDRDNDYVQPYRTYKRRFFGLAQLVLLNIIVSWDWLSFAAISSTSASFFNVSESAINWLSTAFLFSFLVMAPLVIYVLNRSGPKASILVSSALILGGNWVRYGGTRASPPSFGVVMFGQILIGFSQPFVLAAPTRYSNLWFSDRGRVSATALASLANPLGGALGQLVSPLWATHQRNIPSMTLYTAIISTIATIPALFIPKAPPSPPSSLAAAQKLDISEAAKVLPRNTSFWLLLLPFGIYVALFNASSTLINQIFSPYGFTETDAGIAGALLIFVGLAAAAIISPIVDRTKKYALFIKVLVPLVAIAYLILIFMPATRSVAGPWAVCAILGASSFALLPCALEYLALVTHPVSPEVTSVIAWSMGQLLGAVFIVIMNALKGGWSGEPPDSMKRALVFQAVIAWAAVPPVMWLGTGKLRRSEATTES